MLLAPRWWSGRGRPEKAPRQRAGQPAGGGQAPGRRCRWGVLTLRTARWRRQPDNAGGSIDQLMTPQRANDIVVLLFSPADLLGLTGHLLCRGDGHGTCLLGWDGALLRAASRMEAIALLPPRLAQAQTAARRGQRWTNGSGCYGFAVFAGIRKAERGATDLRLGATASPEVGNAGAPPRSAPARRPRSRLGPVAAALAQHRLRQARA